MNRKALVIGINRYPGLDKLVKKGVISTGSSEIPAREAERLAKLLEQYGGFHPVYRFPQGFASDGQPCVETKPEQLAQTGTLKYS